MKNKPTKLVKSLLVGALIFSSSIFANVNTAFADSPSVNVPALTQQQVQAVKPSLAPMLKQVLPAVVLVDVKSVETVNQSNPAGDLLEQLLPKEFQDLIGPNFGNPGGKVQQNVRAVGSGVIIDAEKGYVVTNNHVVQGAKQISIKLHDNRVYNAKVIGTDPKTDLAVIQIQGGKDLQALKLADSSKTEVGDFVVAVGNPFGIGLTATQGIVSALNRTASLNVYDNFIQTDAAINSGNSGGALVDLNGNLVGINTAILSRSGGSVGIGFAIPSNIVKNITSQLIKNGKVTRGQIGVRGSDLTPELVKTLKLPVTKGAFIFEVIDNSASEKAGLKAGDVITKFNGVDIVDFAQLRALVASMPANTTAEVTYIREGKTYTTKVSSEVVADQQTNVVGGSLQVFDAIFANDGADVVVKDLSPKSLLAQYGIRKGDKLVAVQSNEVNSVEELEKVLKDLKSEDVFILKFVRGSKTIYVTVGG